MSLYVTVKKIKLDGKLNSEACPSTVFLLYYTSIFTILQPLGPGYHEIKVNELRNSWDWPWSNGTSAANWGSLKGYLFKCFFFAVIHSTCKHALRKESMIKHSVDDLQLFDDQRRKSARIIWFWSSLGSGFHQLSTACKSDDLGSN